MAFELMLVSKMKVKEGWQHIASPFFFWERSMTLQTAEAQALRFESPLIPDPPF